MVVDRNAVTEVPPELDPRMLFCSTGEDKGDDVNVAVGVRSSGSPESQERVWQALRGWLTAARCQALLGCPCQVVEFPKLKAVDVLARGLLRGAGFDKQGKGLGRALLEALRRI
jgi:hypothetical protein